MIRYNKDNNTLYFDKNAIDFELADITCFDHIIREYEAGLELIRKEIGLDLQRVFNEKEDKDDNFYRISAQLDKKEPVVLHRHVDKQVYASNYDYCRFDVNLYNEYPRADYTETEKEVITPFSVLFIPELDRNTLTMSRFGVEYSFMNLLNKAPGLTWKIGTDNLSANLQFDSGRSMEIIFKKKNIKMLLRGNAKKHDIRAILGGLGEREGLTEEQMLRGIYSLRAFTICQAWGNNYDFQSAPSVMGDSILMPDKNKFTIAREMLKPGYYRIASPNINRRNDLNEFFNLEDSTYGIKDILDDLSFLEPHSSVIGKIASVSMPEFGIEKGEQITKEIVDKLIDTDTIIYYYDPPIVDGFCTMSAVTVRNLITRIPKGTLVPEILREFLDEKFNIGSVMYFPEDIEGIELDLPDEVTVTSELIEFCTKCGMNSIIVSEIDRTTPKAELLCFDREYVFFKKSENNLLTYQQMLHIISTGIKILEGVNVPYMDLDKSFSKRMTPIREIMFNAYKKAFAASESIINSKITQKLETASDYPDFLFDGSAYRTLFWATISEEFWRNISGKLLSARNDGAINPLTYYSQLGRISTKDGHPDSNSISDKERQMPLLSFSRIDAYETPQSMLAGITTNLSLYCKVEENGELSAPYRRLKLKRLGPIEYMTAREISKYKFTDITALDVSENKVNNKATELVLAFVPKISDGDIITLDEIPVKEIEYVTAYPIQSYSVSTSMIPFLTSNNAARVIFGQGQGKQAKSQIEPQIPIVRTRMWDKIFSMNTKYRMVAPIDGYYRETRNVAYKFSGQNIHTGEKAIMCEAGKGKDDASYERNFYPIEYNGGSFSIFKPAAASCQNLDKHLTPIVTSNFEVDGCLALGRNVLVAYVTDGYEYEDGIGVSQDFSMASISYAINKEKFVVPEDSRIVWSRCTKPAMFTYFNDGDDLMDYAFSDSNNVSEFGVFREDLADTEVKTNKLTLKRSHGFLVGITSERVLNRRSQKKVRPDKEVVATLLTMSETRRGDKLSNRHGNKGVITTVFSPEDTLRLSNGEGIEVCLNFTGVGPRMNVGQLKEISLGLACHVLGCKANSDPSGGATSEELDRILEIAYILANSGDKFESELNKLSSTFSEDFIEHLRSKRKWIQYWAGTFDKEGKAMLSNYSGKWIPETKCTVGVIYTYKMIQEAEKGIGKRGGIEQESYRRKTNSASKGMKTGGGRRIGTQEGDAIDAYGLDAARWELYNQSGDNSIARTNFGIDLHSGGQDLDHLKTDMKFNIRRSTEEVLTYLAMLGITIDFPDGTILPMSEYERERATLTTAAVRKAQYVNKVINEQYKSSEDKLSYLSKTFSSILPDFSSEDSDDVLNKIVDEVSTLDDVSLDLDEQEIVEGNTEELSLENSERSELEFTEVKKTRSLVDAVDED